MPFDGPVYLIDRYTPAAYARDNVVRIGIGCACAGCVFLMMCMLGTGVQAALLASVFVLLCFGCSMVYSYIRNARYYQEAAELMESLQNKSQLLSLLEEPAALEARVGYQLCAAVSQWANDAVMEEASQAQAYRNYIELWIHETKTPIAAARLMLANMHGEQAEKLSRELERIEHQVEQALFYARSTSLANDYAIAEVRLEDVIKEALKKNARILIEKNVRPDIEASLGLSVFTDASWFSFMLGQVLVNAAKYGATNVRFVAREERSQTPWGHTVLEVCDDGCGIPAADVARVFDRGFTGQNGRAHGQATGMGLYLVALMAERMGIGVGIASEQGLGTRVIFTFPHDRSPLSFV